MFPYGLFAAGGILRGQRVQDLQVLFARLPRPPLMRIAEEVDSMSNDVIQ
jgi:hypothetical protein